MFLWILCFILTFKTKPKMLTEPAISPLLTSSLLPLTYKFAAYW